MLAYRALQAGTLALLHSSGYWPRLEHRVGAFWSEQRIAQWQHRVLSLSRQDALFVSPANLTTARNWAQNHDDWRDGVGDWAHAIHSGHIAIFDQEFTFDTDNFPWHTDWRWAHQWSPGYYHDFSFYVENKTQPYDVKFPWELSRFAYLLPMAEASVLGLGDDYRDWIAAIVADWEKTNPVAFSVNWFPMEAAMRAINLTLTAQVLASDETSTGEQLAPMLRQLTLHGEFLFRTLEYTDVRGNHYAAAIVALVLIGTTLQPFYKPAQRWLDYAAPRITSEIEPQYCADGVNFEKSVAYHRLVTELFLLSVIALEKSGRAVPSAARERLKKACDYTLAYTRPDGQAPNWGDNDSARVLGFEPRPLRDHGALLALAAAYFEEPAFKTPEASAAIPWLLGEEGVRRWNALPGSEKQPQSRWFEAGGMAVSQYKGHFLFADFGEVGQKGLGGHGHNDIFSFELSLCGVPIVVDAGSPVYTGDLAVMARFRGTASHNVLRVDEQEIATLLGTWRISNEAQPHDVNYESNDERDVIRGEHRGYARLDDPVTHQRTLTFYKNAGRLHCADVLRCAGAHRVEQFLHFAPGLEPNLRENALEISATGDLCAVVTWPPGARARLEAAQVSENYGHLADSQVLVLEHNITGETQLEFEIALERQTNL